VVQRLQDVAGGEGGAEPAGKQRRREELEQPRLAQRQQGEAPHATAAGAQAAAAEPPAKRARLDAAGARAPATVAAGRGRAEQPFIQPLPFLPFPFLPFPSLPQAAAVNTRTQPVQLLQQLVAAASAPGAAEAGLTPQLVGRYVVAQVEREARELSLLLTQPAMWPAAAAVMQARVARCAPRDA
jgi:hypothetical protein